MFTNRFFLIGLLVLLLVGALAIYQIVTSQAMNKNAEKAQVYKVVGPIKTAVFANGCFWCVEHDLEKLEGVIEVVSGYTGGTSTNPTYETYAEGGHREVVEVTYDGGVITYANLVEHIIKHGNPTDGDGSFYDRGEQYAPAIYWISEEEREQAELLIKKVNESGVFATPLEIPVLEASTFYPAEGYHQDYAKENPLKYGYYRKASGRTQYIEDIWGEDLKKFEFSNEVENSDSVTGNVAAAPYTPTSWKDFVLPSEEQLKAALSETAYKVARKDGTERAGSSPLDKIYEPGIYVDVISGEPVFSSTDKFDSGTGWPSFVKPITDGAVTLHEDKSFWSTRTEVRSRFADSHLGHVFNDGPSDRGGLRYCMNGAAMRFIPESKMESEGYAYWLQFVQ